jgi:hypothetical protein
MCNANLQSMLETLTDTQEALEGKGTWRNKASHGAHANPFPF